MFAMQLLISCWPEFTERPAMFSEMQCFQICLKWWFIISTHPFLTQRQFFPLTWLDFILLLEVHILLGRRSTYFFAPMEFAIIPLIILTNDKAKCMFNLRRRSSMLLEKQFIHEIGQTWILARMKEIIHLHDLL